MLAFTPSIRNPLRILNDIQNSEIGSYQHFHYRDELLNVLSLECFLKIEKARPPPSPELNESKTTTTEDPNFKNECW